MNSFVNIFEQIHLMFLGAGQDFIRIMFHASKEIYNPLFWSSLITIYLFYIAFKFFKMEVGLNQILNFIFFFLATITVILITRSENTFLLFVDFIRLPSEVIEDFVSSLLGSAPKDPISIVGELQTSLTQTSQRINIDSSILYYLVIFVYWIFSITLIAIVVLCTLVSSFMATLILGFGLVLFPCLFFKFTTNMFFNWLRAFLFYSILSPASMLMMTFVIQIIGVIQNLEIAQNLNLHQVSAIIIAEIIGICGMWLLIVFINQIVGSQNQTSAMGGGMIGGIIGASSALGITKILTRARESIAGKTMSYSTHTASNADGAVSPISKQVIPKPLSSKREYFNANVPDSKSK